MRENPESLRPCCAARPASLDTYAWWILTYAQVFGLLTGALVGLGIRLLIPSDLGVLLPLGGALGGLILTWPWRGPALYRRLADSLGRRRRGR